jgi:hypothetical protein
MDRLSDAEAVNTLADAAEYTNRVHFGRLQIQHQGRDPRGTC